MKRFVIGDIHGNFKGLLEVLQVSRFDYNRDILYALGDYVDGWPESMEVIDELMKIRNLRPCRGNHDQWALGFMPHEIKKMTEPSSVNPHDDQAKWMERAQWKRHGGTSTAESYLGFEHKWYKHQEWLNELPFYQESDDGKLFVHAGPIIQMTLDDVMLEQPQALIWQRQYVKDLETMIWPHHEEVYIGHTPTCTIRYIYDDGTAIKHKNNWFMDTGAAFAGKVTLMDIDTKQQFQSIPSREAYPDHHGRNNITWNNQVALCNTKSRTGL